MSGSILVTSSAPSAGIDVASSVAQCRPHTSDAAPTWSARIGSTTAVRVWTRADGRNSTITETPTGLEVLLGSGSECRVGVDAAGARGHSDPLGYGTLFAWQGEGIAAIASRVELLAQLARATGQPLEKCRQVADVLPHIGFLMPKMTGYSGVDALDPDEMAEIEGGRLRRTRSPVAVRWTRNGPAPSLDELVDEAIHELTTSVRLAVERSDDLFVDLTAGYDTHLVLGALLKAGLAKDLRFQTIGGPQLNDARVAADRARQLGLGHRTGFPYPTSSRTLGERFMENARCTSGQNNPKDGIREPLAPVAHYRMSGLYGELLRGWRSTLPQDVSAAANPGRIARRFGADRLQLLRPKARERAEALVASEIVDADERDRSAWQAAHRFYARARLRSRACRVDDFTPEARHYPLYSPALLDLGLDAMQHYPEAPLGDLILARLAPVLIDPPTPTETDAPRARPEPATKPESLMTAGLREQRATRAQVFAEIAALESDAWESIDREAFRSAVDGYSELSNLALGLVHAAANAVLWLSDEVD